MKKTALAVISLISTLLLVVVASPFLRLASANPVPWPSTPIQDKPSLTIESPTNNTVYKNCELYINLTVTEPDSWRREAPIPPYAIVASVNASLDGNSVYSSSTYSSNINYSAIKVWYDGSSHFSIPQQSSPGLHVLNVTVLSYSYYRGPAYNGSHIQSDITSSSGPVYQYPIVVSDIIYFTVEQPTQPELFPTTTVATVSGISAVVVVGAVLAIYFKKRKHNA
jgi:hypothetical protein